MVILVNLKVPERWDKGWAGRMWADEEVEQARGRFESPLTCVWQCIV